MEATLNTPGALKYCVVDGKTMFVKDMVFHPFSELPCSDALSLRRALENNPAALKAIERVISDPIEQIEQYAICNFGKLNGTPDFVNGKVNVCETPPTSCRQTCRFNHKVCPRPVAKYGKPTLKEVEVALLVDGHTNKEIANISGRSVNTIITTISHLMQKIGCHERTSIVSWTHNCNLL